MATIKWLEQEIRRLEVDLSEDERQANRFQTQANYHESIDPDLSFTSEQTADKYRSDKEDKQAQIADYQRQIEDLNRQVGQLQKERDRLHREADEKDRQITNLIR